MPEPANLPLHLHVADALSEELDADLFENAPSGYLVTLPDGVIVRANQTFLAWTGYDLTEVVGRRFQDLLTAGGRIFHETHYAPLLRMHGNVREIAVDVVKSDGSPAPMLLNSSLKSNESGQPELVRVSLFEATHRRQYERELLLAKERAESSEAKARGLAQTLQESLMPPSAPVIDGVEVGTAYRPAGKGDEVGGDFYDFFESSRGDWSIVIGDVVGKGVKAATVTAAARYTTRAAAISAQRPSEVLDLLNNALLGHDSEQLCTAIYGRLTHTGGQTAFCFAIGGHALPLLVPPSGDIVAVGRSGHLLGAFEDSELHDAEVILGPGDALVMYTDGVTDARRGDDFFGEECLRNLLDEHRQASATELATAVAKAAVDFQDGYSRDDIAVVVLKRRTTELD